MNNEVVICTDPDCQHTAVFTEAIDCLRHMQCSDAIKLTKL